MKIPIIYSLRNIFRRPVRTLMTAMGVAAVVFASILMLALSHGINSRLDATGEAENILAISRKGVNNMFSEIKSNELVGLSSLAGVGLSSGGAPLVSPEIMHVPYVSVTLDSGEVISDKSISVRGITRIALSVHRSVVITKGRAPQNSFEVMLGKTAYHKLGVPKEQLGIGSSINFEGREWKVVGEFSARDGLFESEIWTNAADLMTVLHRRSYSFVCIRMKSQDVLAQGLEKFQTPGEIERYFKAWSELAYYRDVSAGLKWLNWLSAIMLVVVVVAGALIGINTMYSAVVNRLSEIAVERVLGFSSLDILSSLVVEGVFMCLMGGVLGVVFGFVVNGLPISTMQGAFFLVVDAKVVLMGLGLSAIIGVIGATVPATKGLRMGIVEAMRHG